MRTRILHERFLRHIWSRQFLRRSLRTIDGLEVRVLAPGVLNTGAGPDFRESLVKVGGVTYRGDIEIHRTLIDWVVHRHQDDPHYNNVVLHVVLEQPVVQIPATVESGRVVPLLVLEPFLSESIHKIWEKTILSERLRARRDLACRYKNSLVETVLLNRWLQHLTRERLELKLRRFDERLRELTHIRLLAVCDHRDLSRGWRVQGDPDDIPPPYQHLTPQQLSRRDVWDQILYEGFLEGLGYSKNRSPFLRLARSMTLQKMKELGVHESEEMIQAVLFGASSLLPSLRTVKDKLSRKYVRQLKALWKERRLLYASTVLHSAEWQFFPTRPGNFPTLRMSAASALAHMILAEDLFRKLMETLKLASDVNLAMRSVRHLLSISPHSFWRSHYSFTEPSPSPLHPLGAERRDELITNTVIPIALLYARIFKDRTIRQGALALCASLPTPSQNSVTRLMTEQLIRGRIPVDNAATQQALLQLYRAYCSEGLCSECDVGAVVFGSDHNGE
jgi:hypothetical protein